MTNRRSGPVAQRVAHNIRFQRLSLGWTIQQLSDAVAKMGWPLDVATISKIERGDRQGHLDDLAAFALALRVSPHWLMFNQQTDPLAVTADVTLNEDQRHSWDGLPTHATPSLHEVMRQLIREELMIFAQDNKIAEPPRTP